MQFREVLKEKIGEWWKSIGDSRKMNDCMNAYLRGFN